MFKHIFIARIKCLLREKTLVFWTFIFPIILGTFFNFAFSNLNNIEKFEPIEIAIVNDEKLSNFNNFKITLDSVSKSDSNQIFKTKYVTKIEAEELLKKSEIYGYIYASNNLELVINSNGYKQTIIKSFLDQYLETSSTVSSILSIKPDAIKNGLLNEINNHYSYLNNKSNTNFNLIVVSFYTLIGMICMYAGFWGIKNVNEIEANMSSKGARLSVTPVSKLKFFLINSLAGFIIQFIEMLIVLTYFIFVLKVNFGNQIGYILLICFFGILAGMSFGSMITASNTKSENFKIGILITTSMVFSFLSGMMIIDMKYIINNKIPLLAHINPVNLVTDALYSLYYYTSHTRFYLNLTYLIVFTLICSIITYYFIRRKKYASI